ncbi:hypothetical protein FHW12_000365 [Dokdonella fugitiva]|uniref:Uncharacterized protein n=1 Tax=Dokdonella fugitiva TaxID=328517 RepID=A0A839F1I3_9GAMM|nr:hypothetical protein [Dokdonella fugitiva]MBA8886174.1 hypothetical protein [Dokdonella fugitiva]
MNKSRLPFMLSLLFGTFAAAGSCDTIFASGFEKSPPAARIIEFTVLEYLRVETVTCETWSETFDFHQMGNFSGSKCTTTGPITSQAGTGGAQVNAMFAMNDGSSIALTSCLVQGVAGSGSSGGAIVTFTLDCT